MNINERIDAKDLSDIFKVDLDKAQLALDLMTGKQSPEDENLFPATDKWIRQCYNKPSEDDLIMSALNETLEGFGVESLGSQEDFIARRETVEYINMGDTYATTLIRDEERNFFLGCWGDIVESME